jgi:hypothetical protein
MLSTNKKTVFCNAAFFPLYLFESSYGEQLKFNTFIFVMQRKQAVLPDYNTKRANDHPVLTSLRSQHSVATYTNTKSVTHFNSEIQ